MKKILVAVDDELASLLADFPNQSAIMREATKLYIGHILTGNLDSIKTSYKVLAQRVESMNDKINDMNSKLDYIARKIDG